MNIRNLAVAFLLLLLFILQEVKGQELRIGDSLPDLEFKGVINYREDKIRLSGLKDKLVILVFWSNHCSASIKSLRDLDRLGKEFGDDLQVILVNKESRASTEELFQKEGVFKPDIPIVPDEKKITKLFPYRLVPHHVWIRDGKVLFITAPFHTTPQHVRSLIEGRPLNLPLKKDIMHFDLSKPVFTQLGTEVLDGVEGYSFLTKGIAGLSSGIFKVAYNSKKENRIYMNNISLREMLLTAFKEGNRYNLQPSNAVQIKVRDSTLFVRPEKGTARREWAEKYLFAYDFLVPEREADHLYPLMQKDLMRHFSLKAYIEKRKIKCLVMKRTGKEGQLRTSGGEPYFKFFTLMDTGFVRCRNIPFDTVKWGFQNRCNQLKLDYPFIDATAYNGNVDLQLPAKAFSTMNLVELNQHLSKYGLSLTIQDWMTDVLVITDQ